MQSPHGLTIVPPAAQIFIAGQPRSAVPLNNAVAPHYAAPPYSAAPTSAAPLHSVVLHSGAASAHSALTSEPLSVLLARLEGELSALRDENVRLKRACDDLHAEKGRLSNSVASLSQQQMEHWRIMYEIESIKVQNRKKLQAAEERIRARFKSLKTAYQIPTDGYVPTERETKKRVDRLCFFGELEAVVEQVRLIAEQSLRPLPAAAGAPPQ